MAYKQKETWYHTSEKFLKKVAPDVEEATLEEYPASKYVNTKYICKNLLSKPDRYPDFVGMSERAVKQIISSCFVRVLYFPPHTNRTNRYGGRIFINPNI
jgi:hypothetical protein